MSCKFDIVVEDKQKPAVTCPRNFEVEAVTPLRHAEVTWDAPVFADNDKLISTTVSLEPGQYNAGVHTVTVSATDASGNTNSCTFKFAVLIDTVPPTIVPCPKSVTVATEPYKQSAVVSWAAPVITDDRGTVTSYVLPLGFDSGSEFPLGSTPMTIVAKDAYNNQQSKKPSCPRFLQHLIPCSCSQLADSL